MVIGDIVSLNISIGKLQTTECCFKWKIKITTDNADYIKGTKALHYP